MKIIFSHDVDHIYWSDHIFDTFIPALILRTSRQIIKGEISLQCGVKRLNIFNDLNNLESLCSKLKEQAIPATFFFGMRKGLNLSYSIKRAKPFVKDILNYDFEVGLHGMDYQEYDKMLEERGRLELIIGGKVTGIRNHYLRNNDNTYKTMDSLGYKYDSTDYGIKFPYRVNEMWEIPITLMDVTVLKESKSPQLDDLKDYTLEKIKEATDYGLPFFVINFHDVYYNSGFENLKNWVDWMIDYFVHNNYEFTNFTGAVDQLNRQENQFDGE